MVKNFSLLHHNTFGLEAKAEAFLEVKSIEDVKTECKSVWGNYQQKLILGGGSNLLFASDFKGLVIKPSITGIDLVCEDNEFVWVKAGAGVVWDDFVAYCVEKGYGGIENLSYIPGNVGAAPIQNIGAYGVEAGEFIDTVEYIDTTDFSLKKIKGRDCHFGYRFSIFKSELKGKIIVTHVIFRLHKTHTLITHYGAIEKELEKFEEINIASVRQAIINIRKSKLPEPEELGNAGSFFKNPVITKNCFDKLKRKFPDIKYFDVEDGVKVPAGWLIEKSGWKGLRIGKVGMHENQALVLVNYGGATGLELVRHAENVKASVFEKFEIELDPEVNIIK